MFEKSKLKKNVYIYMKKYQQYQQLGLLMSLVTVSHISQDNYSQILGDNSTV